jgi:hypothetical protein
MAGKPFTKLLDDDCRYVIVGPFLADLLYEQVTPDQYPASMQEFIDHLLRANPDRVIFVLGHYQVDVPQFVSEQKVYVAFSDHARIESFIAKLADACQPRHTLGRYHEVICIDTQRLFAELGNPYLVTEATYPEYQAFHDPNRPTKFESQVNLYFQENPDGQLIGDGFHMNLAARIRLLETIAALIESAEKQRS